METRGKFKNITDEELIELYINQNMSAMELADYYGVTEGALRSCLSRRGIHKSKEQIAAKSKELLMKKYGVTSTLQLAEVQDKIKKTCLEKYGNESVCAVGGTIAHERLKTNPFSEEKKKAIRAKSEKTTMERYGVKHAAQSPEIQEKLRQQWQEKYGVDNPMQLAEFKQRMQDSVREKYGVDNVMQRKEFVQQMLDSRGPVAPPFQGYRKSPSETSVKQWAEANGYGVEQGNRRLLYPLEVDLWIPEVGIGIEYNGNYYHSAKRVSLDYHQQKYLKAKERGIVLCQIFEYEWKHNRDHAPALSYLSQILPQKALCVDEEHKIVLLSSEEGRGLWNYLSCVDIPKGEEILIGVVHHGQIIGISPFVSANEGKWQWLGVRLMPSYYIADVYKEVLQYFLDLPFVRNGEEVEFEEDFCKPLPLVDLLRLGFIQGDEFVPRLHLCRGAKKYEENKNTTSRTQIFEVYDAGGVTWNYKIIK